MLLDMGAQGGGGGNSAPIDAAYIVQTPNGDLTNEQALSALATGLLKNTTVTGVLSIATPTVDYASAAQGILADNAVQPGDLSTVAISGSYDDLLNLPTLGTLSAINDAPSDGSTYGRNNGAWAAVLAGVTSVFARTGVVVSANGDYTASQITNVAAGNIAGVTVQTALNELDTEKAGLALANVFTSPQRFRGTLSTAQASLSRVDIGLFSGTPGILLEDTGFSTIWRIDNEDATFRILTTAGAVPFTITTSLIAHTITSRFTGTVSEAAASIDRIDIGVTAGSPRMVFENSGFVIWQIDNEAGEFRWFTPGNVVFKAAANPNILTVTGRQIINQTSATAAAPTLRLQQADLSEEFIRFQATVGAGNPIDTAALGAYYGKIRVYVEGVGAKWLALYD